LKFAGSLSGLTGLHFDLVFGVCRVPQSDDLGFAFADVGGVAPLAAEFRIDILIHVGVDTHLDVDLAFSTGQNSG